MLLEKFINVAPTESIEIVELAKFVNEISDYKSEIIIKSNGLNKEYTADNSKLLKIMCNPSFISYKNGMNRLYKGRQNDQ